MAVISGGFNTDMDRMEEKLSRADFSKYTDLKERLAVKLFSSSAFSSKKVTAFTRLSDDQVELVNAAQGVYEKKPDEDQF